MKLSGILRLSSKVFLISLRFSKRNYSKMFRKSNVVYFILLSSKYREIITVKTIKLYKKLYFFHLKLQNQGKEAGTNWHLLC